MRKPLLACLSLAVLGACVFVAAQDAGPAKVRLRLVDAATGNSVGGMVRVTDADGQQIELPGLFDRGQLLPLSESRPVYADQHRRGLIHVRLLMCSRRDGNVPGEVIDLEGPRRPKIEASAVSRYPIGRLELVQNGKVITSQRAAAKELGRVQLTLEARLSEPKNARPIMSASFITCIMGMM
jgi:hypothetical protein